jgi:K(+)-stimulated pyrophosphate-energized sodium pump
VFTSTTRATCAKSSLLRAKAAPRSTVLSGLVAGNFSAYWIGLMIVALMSIAYGVSLQGLGAIMVAPSVFAFGLVAFGFLGMGPSRLRSTRTAR